MKKNATNTPSKDSSAKVSLATKDEQNNTGFDINFTTKCTIRDFIAASQYTSTDDADCKKTVGGLPLLLGDAKDIYDVLISRVQITTIDATESKGIKRNHNVACINGKNFSQETYDNKIRVTSETALFPVDTLWEELNEISAPSKPTLLKAPRLYWFYAFCFTVIFITLVGTGVAMLFGGTLNSLVITGIVMATFFTIPLAEWFYGIQQIPKDTNWACKTFSKWLGKKSNSANLSHIRESILYLAGNSNPDILSDTAKNFVRKIENIHFSTTKEQELPGRVTLRKTQLLFVITTSLLVQQYQLSREDIVNHVEKLLDDSIISDKGFSNRNLHRHILYCFDEVRRECLHNNRELNSLEKKLSGPDKTSATRAVNKKIIELLGGSFKKKEKRF